MFNPLTCLDFVREKENLILTGPSGVGKSYLAQAIGTQACQMGIRTQYHITARLFNRLKLAKVDGTYSKELKRLQKIELLILETLGNIGELVCNILAVGYYPMQAAESRFLKP